MHCRGHGRNAQWKSWNAPPQCLGAMGTETHVMHGRTAWGQGAVELVQCTAIVLVGMGEWNCCIVQGQRAVELLQCSATLPTGSGQ